MEKGGAQKAMLSLASTLSREDFEVTVCTMYDKENYIEYFEEVYDLKIINLRMKDLVGKSLFTKILAFGKGVLRFKKLARDIDIVQTYSHTANIVFPFFAFLFGVKIRVTSQRMSLDRMSKKIQLSDKLIENSFLVTKLTSVSEGTKRSCIDIQGIRPEKIITIPNGIDLSRIDSELSLVDRSSIRNSIGLSDSQVAILTVARFHKQKGHQYLLDAILELKDDYPEAVFIFVGHGELEQEIASFIKGNNLEDHVRLLGARNDVPAIMNSCDIFILPSLWEGMPNTVLEAMSVSMPTIATSVDGTPELIIDRSHGVLIPSKNSGAIKQEIEFMLNNSEFRKSLGVAARKRIEDVFSLEKTTKSFADLYKKLMLRNG